MARGNRSNHGLGFDVGKPRNQGVLTDQELKVALALAARKPTTMDLPGVASFWYETVRDVADALFQRPVYDAPLNVAMNKWAEFVSTAGYFSGLTDPLAAWTEGEKREAWGR